MKPSSPNIPSKKIFLFEHISSSLGKGLDFKILLKAPTASYVSKFPLNFITLSPPSKDKNSSLKEPFSEKIIFDIATSALASSTHSHSSLRPKKSIKIYLLKRKFLLSEKNCFACWCDYFRQIFFLTMC